MRTALITGILGQDASYLAELLLERGYYVVGARRRSSNPNYENIKNIRADRNFVEEICDITDPSSIADVFNRYKPSEVYNLAAQSHVHVSFSQPALTFQCDTIGVLNILEEIRFRHPQTRMYQASTSEMFGKNVSMNYDVQGCSVRYDGPIDINSDAYHERNGLVNMTPVDKTDGIFQDEKTTFSPQSPYAIAKVAAHQLCQLYRQAYNVQVSCGILFNHESPRRGKEFVTRKVTNYIGELVRNCSIKCSGIPASSNFQTWDSSGYPNIRPVEGVCLVPQSVKNYPKLELGNLSACRDWGHAKDYMMAAYLMLQSEPDDYVVSTGETNSIETLCQYAFETVGLDWKFFVRTNNKFMRAAEVDFLLGDSSKIRHNLNWRPSYTFKSLIQEMVRSDIGA